jgi:4-amino-4-deoxy-L-arabinose transferase-like glycosyltransferase
MELFGEGDVALRALSGIIAVATLPLAWAAGCRLGGRRVGALALVVLALSPYAVRYGSEARMYSLVMLLVLAGYVALVEGLRGGSRWWLVVLGLSAGLLPWTHYWGLYLVAAVGALLVWRWWHEPELRPRVRLAIVSIVAGTLPFVLWLPVLLDQAAHTGTPWGEPTRPTTMFVDTLDAMGGGAFAEARVYGVVAFVLAIIGACTTDADGRLVLTGHVVEPMRRLVFAIIATVGLGCVLGILSGSTFAPRYAAVIVPLVLLVVAVGLSRSGADGLLGVLGVGLLILSVVGILHNVPYLRTQNGEHAELIAREAGQGDVVVVCPDQLGPSMTRALEKEGLPPPVPYPEGDPHFVDWRDYKERNEAADPVAFAEAVLAEAGDAPIWLVWHDSYETFEGQCEAMAARFARDRALTLAVGADEDAFERAHLNRFG